MNCNRDEDHRKEDHRIKEQECTERALERERNEARFQNLETFMESVYGVLGNYLELEAEAKENTRLLEVELEAELEVRANMRSSEKKTRIRWNAAENMKFQFSMVMKMRTVGYKNQSDIFISREQLKMKRFMQ